MEDDRRAKNAMKAVAVCWLVLAFTVGMCVHAWLRPPEPARAEVLVSPDLIDRMEQVAAEVKYLRQVMELGPGGRP